MNDPEKNFEILAQNARKGELYRIKLKDDPVVYTCIPLMNFALKTDNDTKFTMRVFEPEDRVGTCTRFISEIELLEKLS